jgi:hypothetical protein
MLLIDLMLEIIGSCFHNWRYAWSFAFTLMHVTYPFFPLSSWIDLGTCSTSLDRIDLADCETGGLLL